MSLTRSASGFWPVLGRKALAMSVFAGNCPGIERDFRRRCDLGQRPIRSFRRGSTCRSEPPGSGIGYRTDLIETLEVSMRECRLQLPTISRDNGQIHPLERISLESLSENQIHRHLPPVPCCRVFLPDGHRRLHPQCQERPAYFGIPGFPRAGSWGEVFAPSLW